VAFFVHGVCIWGESAADRVFWSGVGAGKKFSTMSFIEKQYASEKREVAVRVLFFRGWEDFFSME
jgi:hypothetical protein